MNTHAGLWRKTRPKAKRCCSPRESTCDHMRCSFRRPDSPGSPALSRTEAEPGVSGRRIPVRIEEGFPQAPKGKVRLLGHEEHDVALWKLDESFAERPDASQGPHEGALPLPEVSITSRPRPDGPARDRGLEPARARSAGGH